MRLFVATRPRGSLAACLLLITALPAHARPAGPQAAQEWPRWRNSGFDGTAAGPDPFAAPFRLEVRWRRRLGSGYSGVVIADGQAVTMFSDHETDHLVALDAGTGETRWQVPIAPTYRGREGANDGPVSTPAIAGGVVYAVGPQGDVLAVSLSDGAVLWKVHLARDFHAPVPHWGFGGSPLVAGERLILPAGGAEAGTILALDRRTGARVWKAGSDDVSYQSPMMVTLEGEDLVLAAGDHVLFAVDPSTGAERWRIDHDGEGFYARIINPVQVDGGGLLLTDRPDEARLLQIAAPDGTIQGIDAWRTPHLSHNYATPVHHRGHLYGYSGDFLTSVDARTGSLDWRSRPPGNGFPILVGEHLVVLTKDGTLHVIEATPASYREEARLDLFPDLTWTPPSFAGGAIFARDSHDEVACVDVVSSEIAPRPAADGPPAAGNGPEGELPDSRFGRFVRSLQEAPDREERVRRFLADQPSFPLIEDDRLVHLIYQGEADDLVVRGDMLETGEVRPMHAVPGTDLHYFSFLLAPDARINYQFIRDLDESLPDPRNPRQSDSMIYRGKVSQLLMPDHPPTAFAPAGSKDPRGRIESFTLDSPRVRVGAKTWGGERSIQVYLPDGYDGGIRRYPTIYVLYGEQMREAGLERLLEARAGRGLPPMIVVFVESTSPYEYARSQRHVHRRMLVEQLVPRIDATYRTLPDAAQRVILGADEGGVSALEAGLHDPGIFGTVIAQSVFPVGAGDEELLELAGSAPAGSTRIWLDWGIYDQRSAVRRIDVPGFSQRLRDRLVERGFDVTAREWDDGSDVVFWASRAADALQKLFTP